MHFRSVLERMERQKCGYLVEDIYLEFHCIGNTRYVAVSNNSFKVLLSTPCSLCRTNKFFLFLFHPACDLLCWLFLSLKIFMLTLSALCLTFSTQLSSSSLGVRWWLVVVDGRVIRQQTKQNDTSSRTKFKLQIA